MIDEDRTTWTLGQLADEVIEACELPMGCRATIIAALGDAKLQGRAMLEEALVRAHDTMLMVNCRDLGRSDREALDAAREHAKRVLEGHSQGGCSVTNCKAGCACSVCGGDGSTCPRPDDCMGAR